MNDPIVPVGGGVPVDPETGRRYGYLPRKAARRKLVIRAELGIQWIIGAAATALFLLIAGVVFFLSRPQVPGAPYVDEGPLSAYPEQAVTPLPDGEGWIDRRSGLVAVGGDVAFCPADGGWVDEEGRRYDAEGRSENGVGLSLWAVKAAAGHVYVDRSGWFTSVMGDAEPLPPCPAPWDGSDPRPPSGL